MALDSPLRAIKINYRGFTVLLCVLAQTASSSLLGQQPVPSAASTSAPAPVTSLPAQELFPSVAPDGTLAYSRLDGPDWDVFVQRPGANRVNLTADSPGNDWQAEFSPDGKWLAFRSERDGGGIYMMDPNGRSLQRLTTEGFNPTWSPDGKEVAYSSVQIIADPGSRPVRGTLSAVNIATLQRRTLYTVDDAVQPRWSPNGRRVAFWAFAKEGGQRDIWTIGLPYEHAGAVIYAQPVAVTDDAATDWNPVWSPDGKYLYYASDRSGTMEIWRVAIDEETGITKGSAEQLTTGGTGLRGHIAFADKGASLLYVDQTSRQVVEKVGFDAVSGKTTGELTPVLDASVAPANVDVSPDGQSLAFYSAGRQEDIFVSRNDGTNRRRLTNDPARDRGPSWAPGGKKIAFFSDRNGSYEIWTINADGTGLTQVTNSRGANRSTPIWSPDGSRLLYLQRRGQTWDNYIVDYVFDPEKPPAQQAIEELPAIGRSDEYFAPTSWSPDGKMIAGNRSFIDRFVPGGIFVYTLATRAFRMIVDGAAGARWLNDNRRLIYPDAAARKIFLVDTRSGQQQAVLSVAQDLGPIRLTSDNRTLYVQLSTTQSGIWRMNLPEAP
jgi:Tol biopolymer transport system component